MGEEVVGLEDHPDLAAHLARIHQRVGDLPAVEGDGAVVDVLQQVETAQQRRLARPAEPIRQITSCGVDVEVDVAQHHLVAVRLAQVVDPQQRRSSATAVRGAEHERSSQSVKRASGTVMTTKKAAATSRGV